jgi:predicted  nucleic acid-binding Zn-ribbon protein
MIRYTKYVPWLAVIVLLAVIILRPEPEGNQLYVDQLHEQIEALNKNISRLEDENSKITTDIELKMDSIQVLELDVQYIKDKRAAAIRYYEKRINDVDNWPTSDLDSFFIARYQGRRDTTEVDRN